MFSSSYLADRDAILLRYTDDRVQMERVVDGYLYEKLDRPLNFDLWRHGVPVIRWGRPAHWYWTSGITYAP